MRVLYVFTLLSILFVVGEAQTEISTDNGSNRGSWGNEDLCPSGSYATYSQAKFEKPGQLDDTYMNGIRLFCYTRDNTLVDYVFSKEGKQGKWQEIYGCPNNGRIKGYTMKVQEPAGSFHDDYAVMDVVFVCEDGSLIHPVSSSLSTPLMVPDTDKRQSAIDIKSPEIVPVPAETGADHPVALKAEESWGQWAMCDQGSYVCGIKSRVERQSLATDDAGLCDLHLFCCN